MISKNPKIFSVSTIFAAPKYSLDLHQDSLQQVVSFVLLNVNRHHGCHQEFKALSAVLLFTLECFVRVSSGMQHRNVPGLRNFSDLFLLLQCLTFTLCL